MKTIPAELLTHLAQETTTTCWLLKIVCVGAFAGQVYGLTNLDVDADYDDGDGTLTYSSTQGFVPMRIEQSAQVTGGDTEGRGVVNDSGITLALLRAGLFDSAKVWIYRVNYNDLTAGRHEVVFYGRAGQARFTQDRWGVEFWPLSKLLTQPINEPYSRTCNAQFGDARCGMALTWTAGTVTSLGAETDRQFTASGLSATADDYYKFGVIEWLTGDNAGAQMDVDTNTGGAVDLALSMPFAIQVGDTFQIRKDCSKVHDDADNGCLFHWSTDWINHFRGQPHIPLDGTAMVPGAEINRA